MDTQPTSPTPTQDEENCSEGSTCACSNEKTKDESKDESCCGGGGCCKE